MLAWLNPIALLGVIAAAGPIAVHLLRRQRARRVPFASLRFVRASATAAVRLRLPSDIWLLLLRVAIVGAAAAALAQPLLLTPSRRAAWNARTSRAIVVDTSASVATGAVQREEAAAAETRGAVYSARIDVERLGDGLVQAVTVLSASAPALSRREIVVISDLRQGSLTPADVARIPPGVGLRFVAIDAPPASEQFRGDTTLGANGLHAWAQHVHPTLDATAVRVVPLDTPAAGLRLVNAGPAEAALLRAVARAGAPAPSEAQPLALTFGETPTPLPNPSNPATLWMLRTILGMRRDTSLADAALEHRRQGICPPSWIVVARDSSGAPVVAAMPGEHELIVHLAGTSRDYLAAAALRSALTARRGEPAWGEYELARIPGPALSAWTRPASEVDPRDARNLAPGDARGAWVLVVVLLAVEGVTRRRRPRKTEAYADAA